MRFSLSEEDRERLGCDEWLDLDLEYLPVDLCIELDEAGGQWGTLLTGGARGVKARVWLALKRADISVPYADLTFDMANLRYDRDAGKAPSSEESEPSTSQTS